MFGSSQKGFAAIYITLVVLAVLFSMGSSLFFTTFQEQARIQNNLRSSQAYVGAESGLEDALLRVSEGMNVPPTYIFSVAGTEAEVVVVEDISRTRTITVKGDRLNRIRNVEGVYALSGTGSAFFFGAQIGEGGLEMDGNSTVIGNVYSNGSIKGDSGAEITGSAIVAGDEESNNEIKNVIIGGDAMAPSFDDCTIGGDATFIDEIDDCSVGGSIIEQEDPIPSSNFPISQSQIDQWKADAVAGGIISSGNYSPPSYDTVIIGPGVIEGDLELDNNQTVILTGIVYVKGGIDIENGGSVVLSSSYGASSGVLLTDTWIHIKNNGEFRGSGTEGSYLMMMALGACEGGRGGGDDCTDHNGAVDLHNNVDGAIFYAPFGLMNLHNNVNIAQATAWKLKLSNNAILEYSIGLASALFTSGPTAGWELTSWKEVE